MTDKKKALIALSKLAKAIQEMEGDDRNINTILIEDFYTKDQHHEFKTFQDWKKNGMNVKKGEKAFLIWGKKRQNEKKETPQTEKKEDTEYSFYPICYLFSNAQIQQNAKK
jgi:hypothetical protein